MVRLLRHKLAHNRPHRLLTRIRDRGTVNRKHATLIGHRRVSCVSMMSSCRVPYRPDRWGGIVCLYDAQRAVPRSPALAYLPSPLAFLRDERIRSCCADRRRYRGVSLEGLGLCNRHQQGLHSPERRSYKLARITIPTCWNNVAQGMGTSFT